MQVVLDAPHTQTHTTQTSFAFIADTYLDKTLGACYRAGEGRCMENGDWQFLIVYQSSALKRPWTIGKMVVDSRRGVVKPLTKTQIEEIHERALIAVAEAQEELPLINGYVPKIFAKREANRYLSSLTMSHS